MAAPSSSTASLPAPDQAATRPRNETGAALLLFLFVLLTFLSTVFLSAWNTNAARANLDRQTADAMARAKEALIARAVNDDNHPGSLPCPDANDDGNAEATCSIYIGRLPYKTLNIGDLRDGYGERLWYALSPTLKDGGGPVNAATPMALKLDANTDVAALIFSPGPPLPGQGGRPGNLVTDYLDGSNADGDTSYVSGPATAAFNDKVVAVTGSELFKVVNRRVLAEVRGPDDNTPSYPKTGLRRYYGDNGGFPSADTNGDGIGDGAANGLLPRTDLQYTYDAAFLLWMNNNGWFPLIGYSRPSPSAAIIQIGSTKLKVEPCTTSPCP